MGFALQLRQFSLSSRLQVFRCELFQLLSIIGEHYGPIVRFRLPSYSAVPLCIRGIRCEWRTMKRISYWTSRSTSSSTLATMAISSSASIRKSYQTRLTNMTNLLVHLMVEMSWKFSTDFVRRLVFYLWYHDEILVNSVLISVRPSTQPAKLITNVLYFRFPPQMLSWRLTL